MPKKARPTGPSVSLFPFLSILACLIGTIVVLICILSIIQAQHMGGRPRKEVVMAMEYVAAQKKIQEQNAKLAEVNDKITKDDEAKKLRDELGRRVIRLRLQLEAAKDGDQGNRALQKELELALIQLAEMTKEKPPIVQEIEHLTKELAARKKDPKDLVPEVIVRPGGSGIVSGGNLFFVEATGGALTLYKTKSETARITSGSIGADKEYDSFLEKVAAIPNATLVFLIRSDGWTSYVRGAGWAEGTFKVKTAKLPIPTKGAIDLGQFERLMAQ